jgi:outer membrane protein OmpA-like peptidoglycan-associated protein
MRKLYILLIANALYCNMQAQTNIKADKQYNNFAYMSAVETYQKNGEPSDAASLRQLANSYRLNGDYNAAVTYYQMLMSESPSTEDMLYFAQSLLASGNCEDAVRWFKKYATEAGEKAKQRSFITDCAEISTFSQRNIEVKPLAGINSDAIEFAAMPYRNGVVFTSTRGDRQTCRDSWTGTGYTDMFFANIKEDNVEKISDFNEATNQRYHDGTPTFNKAGTLMYFTRNQANMGEANTKFLKIYVSKYRSGAWSEGEELPFNGNNFSTCHPSLSLDGKRLYFASDRVGGKGGMDIWYADLQNGKWSAPKNLTEINTAGNEVFPHINGKNVLFFASDGQKGMGGLDIFSFEQNKIENMGTPINSSYDDFSYVEKDSQSGFLSSNRKGGLGGDDDIYLWKMIENSQMEEVKKEKSVAAQENKVEVKDFPSTYKIKLIAIDAKNGQPLQLPLITVAGGNIVPRPELKNNLELEIYPNVSYTILVENEGFEPRTISVMGIEMLKSPDYYVPLLKKNTPSLEGKPLRKGEIIIINDIFYDYDKSNIRSDASIGLKRLADVMLKYPSLEVELSSHTDSRGRAVYNENLSQRRANEAVGYLVSRGIDAKRLIAKGYGERFLTNRCADGINCAEEEHQKNRRTEVKILKFEEEGVDIIKE